MQEQTEEYLTKNPLYIATAMRRIASGERPHGDFLTLFARAWCHTDAFNVNLLRPVAIALILKYNLWYGEEVA